MIPQTLKLGDGGKIVIHDLHVVVGGDGGGDLDQVIAHLVCHGVYIRLVFLNLFHALPVILGKHGARPADIGLCQLKHHQKDVIAPAKGHGRGADEHRV